MILGNREGAQKRSTNESETGEGKERERERERERETKTHHRLMQKDIQDLIQQKHACTVTQTAQKWWGFTYIEAKVELSPK